MRLPTVEVHVSTSTRGKLSAITPIIARAAFASLTGFGVDGYRLAIIGLAARLGIKAKA